MSGNIVIVGSGQAGVSAAFKLRALGVGGHIALVNAEPDMPYHRPPLSKKYLADGTDAQRLHIKSAPLYESSDIQLMTNCHAVHIDRGHKQVELQAGGRLHYDHLILATGASPRRLSPEQGGDARNVHTFRTLSDVRRLREHMVEGGRLLVIGGGYIGLETAAVARGLGMEVTLIERDSRILGRVASAETAAYFKALHEDHGVRVLAGMDLVRLHQHQGRVEAASLADGTKVDVDVVVVGIGVVPETGLAQQAGLQVDNGIVVDRTGRTSDPAIYAAGDCARFPYQGRSIRLESVQNAVDMAEIVARSIAGESVEYQPVPWFWSDQYSTKLQIAGLNAGYTRVAVRRTSASAMSIWYYDDARFIAVDAINDAKAFMTAKRWLSERRSPDANEIADPAVVLNAVSVRNDAAAVI